MARLFGTDGVRGIANTELTAELGSRWDRREPMYSHPRQTAPQRYRWDTRISGYMLESALVAGICSVGAEAVCLDVIPRLRLHT